ncbi:myeloid leukemia factor [Copidosoma floridanum]|uniref:myeloid leukemia factor n=1 Tax=Copidosoma floridanum TaxID=29053 RepID=UPI0006C9B318|nr:myeloid leukemia factor [Copidosoma floridanum]
MSRFGLLMGDFEDDPFFGAHMQSMQQMNNMMNSMFADPFGMMAGPPAIMGGQSQNRQLQMPGMQMMPFGFPSMGMNLNRMFSDLQNINSNPNCHSFTSSSMMTMTTGPDGRPQVYQESMSSRTGPGGVKETKKSVSDSRTGTRKLAIGHHIGERAHIIEREKNEYTGDQEEHQDFINLDEEEVDTFNHEWQSKTRSSLGAIGNSPYRSSYDRAQANRQLALPSTAPSDQQSKNLSSRILAAPRRTIKNALSSKKSKSKHKDSSRSAESTSTSNSANTSSSTSKVSPSSELPEDLSSSSSNNNNNHSNSSGRKREHSPDIEEIENPNHKRRSHGATSDE